MTSTASDLALQLSGTLTATQCAELVAMLRREERLSDMAGPLERRFGSSSWIGAVTELACPPTLFADLVELAERGRAAERAAQHVEFVWTGPATNRVATQTTEQTFLELIDRATRRVIVMTYAAREVESLVGALELADKRGVSSIVICETQMRGQPFNEHALKRLKKMPALRAYGWPERPDGSSLHAKLVVADGERALVTSANLTQAALRRNIEAGVLLEGGTVPQRIEAHVLELIAVGEFAPI
jgi:phosphatidylserine/phosphatidylglycerophosphate/cardiolipin synthase-like enzyme